jgi:transcriptional/translational regulatory protein YebC/TACO1
MLLSLDAGAEDFKASDDGYEIITLSEDFAKVRDTLAENDIEMISADVTMLAKTTTTLSDAEDIKKMNKLLDLLDNEDDVQNFYHNGEWD